MDAKIKDMNSFLCFKEAVCHKTFVLSCSDSLKRLMEGVKNSWAARGILTDIRMNVSFFLKQRMTKIYSRSYNYTEVLSAP